MPRHGPAPGPSPLGMGREAGGDPDPDAITVAYQGDRLHSASLPVDGEPLESLDEVRGLRPWPTPLPGAVASPRLLLRAHGWFGMVLPTNEATVSAASRESFAWVRYAQRQRNRSGE